MHMKFSTHMENTWEINTSLLSYPSKTYPYSLETVSMKRYPILCIVYFQDARDQINIKYLYIYINRIVRCPWKMLHIESSIYDQ